MMATAMAGCLDSAIGNSAPTVQMSIKDKETGKTTTFRVGDLLTFDATGSSDPNGDPMSYEWDFGDGNTGNSQTVEHAYNMKGSYTVELCVSDSDLETCDEQTITVADADAALPSAAITGYKDNSCDGNDPSSGTHTLVWICEEAMDPDSDTFIDATTTVYLDGGESSAGDDNSYITKWEWDLNVNVDSDGDDDPENDADLEGENPEWTNVKPGEYEIKLTVTDNNGFTADDDTRVYVNYRGAWAEFTIEGNGTQGAATVTFGIPVVYDSDEGNTIRKVYVVAHYPIEDDDWAIGSANNRLDLYAYNHTEEEVTNTSSKLDEDQTSNEAGECDEENDRCLELYLGGSTIRSNEDGDWTVDLVNEKQWDTLVKTFVVLIEYK